MSEDPPLPKDVTTGTSLKRDDWMLEPPAGSSASPVVRDPRLEGGSESLTEDYGEPSTGARALDGEIDFFSSLGKERKRKSKPDLPDPDKVSSSTNFLPVYSNNFPIQLHVSLKELNTQLKEGKSLNEYSDAQAPKPITPGGPGSQWRMMRLRRVYETAQEENRLIEEVAIERFGSLGAFDQAKEERRILDERGRGRGPTKGRRREDPGNPKAGEKGFMFNDLGGSGGSSRSSS